MCWDVDVNLTGTCTAMCIGTPDAPDCADPLRTCVIADVLNLCLPQCDPLAQDCPNGEVCIAIAREAPGFLCVLATGRDGDAFSPCFYANVCDPGLACLAPDLATECDPKAPGCCLPFCDIDLPNTCPGLGLECVPWYADPAEAAPFNVDVGLCQLPAP